MAEPANVMKGSVRIANAGVPAYVAGTNSGFFDEATAIIDTGAGDMTCTLDADKGQLGPRDVVEGQIEGAAGGTVSVVRLTTTTLQVLTFSAAGVAADVDVALTIATHNIG